MKRFSIFLLTFLLIFSTSGCQSDGNLFANYRAIEDLKLVHTLGFDTDPEGLKLSICAGETENQGLTRLSVSGKNISDALANVQNYSDKEELYYAHTRYVVVGEDYAKEVGIGDILQYLESDTQLRSDLPLFIVKGGKAEDIVLHSGGEKHGIFEILESVVRNCTERGDSYPFTCGDIGVFSAEYGSALVCALTLTDTKNAKPEAEDEEKTPIVSGYGILQQGDLVGYIPEDAAKGINLLIGELGTGNVTVTLDQKPVSLRLRKVDTTLMPEFGRAGTMTKLTVDMELQATLEEADVQHNVRLDKLSNALSKTVQQWVDEILRSMQNTGTDFLGFGPRIAIQFPKQWQNNRADWAIRLKTLPMEARVSCTITMGENEPRR